MKRFDDFIRLLLSFLISELFRRADEISEHIEAFFQPEVKVPEPGLVAAVAPYALILLYLRNIHASILFDRKSEKANYRTWLDNTQVGCAVLLILSHAALFWSPYATGHLLTSHLGGPGTHVLLPLFLLSPFAIYFVWDVLLIFRSTPRTSDAGKHLDVVIVRWLTIDALGALAILLTAIVTMWGRGSSWAPSSENLLGIFILVVGLTVFADYAWNAKFYFSSELTEEPVVASEAPPPSSPEVADPRPAIPVPVVTIAGAASSPATAPSA